MNALLLRRMAKQLLLLFSTTVKMFLRSKAGRIRKMLSILCPVFAWLTEYEKSPNPETVFHFNFQYYNTASAKQVFRIISYWRGSFKKQTVIHWHHDAEDEDMFPREKGSPR